MNNKREIMTPEADIVKMIDEIGRDNGYTSIEVEIAQFRDFKFNWSRTLTRWIHLTVPDYIKYLPTDKVRALVELIYARITGADMDYPKELREALLDDGFCYTCQPIYLRRSRLLSDTSLDLDSGFDLREWWVELADRGLVEGEIPVLRWHMGTRNPRGYGSPLFRVLLLSWAQIPLFQEDHELGLFALYQGYCAMREAQAHFSQEEYDLDAALAKFGPDTEAMEIILLRFP